MANYTEYWIDYSAAKLTGSQVKAASWNGHPLTGAIRYIDAPNLLRTKHTNKAEYDSLVGAGLKVRLVMQNTTTDADGGYPAGVANAQRAKAGADYLGYKGVIFFTNDRTEVPNPRAWTDYLDGAASVLGKDRVGAYGFKNALNYAVGHAAAFWQAGRESDLVNHANVYQWNNGQISVAGVTCDLNKVVKDYVPAAGSTVAIAKGDTDLMERVHVKAPNADVNTVRVRLSGTENAAVIVRPGGMDRDGKNPPIWVGPIFAWGSDKVGVGHNPSAVPGYNPRMENGPRRFELPGAVWADIQYSADPANEFDVDCF
jgi:hypothetical protein